MLFSSTGLTSLTLIFFWEFIKICCIDENVSHDFFSTGFFHEHTSNVECIEGEDIVFSVKVPFESGSFEWLKNRNTLIQHTDCVMSKVDKQYNLKLKNTTKSDKGEYCLQVGQFSKIFKLHIKGM